MLHYEFPKLHRLEQVLEVIQEDQSFLVVHKDLYTVVNYLYNSPETFPEVQHADDQAAQIRRECRGLIFDTQGVLISRPFHKFFNLSERDETQPARVDLSQPHTILEKLDGSMVRPIPLADAYRLGTKAGITEVSMQAEVFVARNPEYDEFIRAELAQGRTVIFEWCSRRQRIVLDYPQDRLVLTAVRDNVTGEYLSLAPYREQGQVEVVQEFESGADSLTALIQGARDAQDLEGWVLRFDSGHMLKVKADWYVLRHRSKDKLTREKDVVDMLINDAGDDVKALLVAEDRDRLEQFETKFWSGLQAYAADLEHRIQDLIAQAGQDRKTFALEYAPRLQSLEQGIAFGVFGGKSVLDQVRALVARNTHTATNLERVRFMFGCHWEYAYE